jgi:hypothetical protein
MYLTSSKFLAAFNTSGKAIFKTIIRRSDGSTIPDEKMPDFLDGTVNIQNDSVRRKCTLSFRTQTPSVEWLKALDDPQAQWEVFAGTSREKVNYGYFQVFGTAGNYVSIPHAANLNLSTFELVGRCSIANIATDYQSLITKRLPGLEWDIMWAFGGLNLWRSSDGSTWNLDGVYMGTFTAVTNNVPFWWKITHNPTTGAYASYYATDQENEPTSWTLVASGSTTTLTQFAGTGSVLITSTGASFALSGKLYRTIVRNGIDGPVVFDTGSNNIPVDVNATSFTASTGQTVTINRSGVSPLIIMPLTVDVIEELVPQGKFYVKDTPIDEPGSYITYRLSLQDASLPVGERRTTVARTYSGDITDVVISIIDNTGFETIFRHVSTGIIVTNYLVDIDQDPWDVCYKLLENVGFEFFFDVAGQCVIRPVTDIGTNTLNSLDLSTCVLSKQSTLSRRAVNHIIVLSTDNRPDSIPVRGEAFDNDPSSPAYYAIHTDVPKIFRLSGITSQEQATLMAEKLGIYHFRRSESIMFATLSYPVLEVNDPFMVKGETYLADQISVPLAVARPMYVTSHKGPSNG